MKYTAFDTETTGFRKYEGDQIFSYGITDWDGKTDIYRIPFTNGSKEFMCHDNYLRLQDYWSDNSIAKVIHNAKFDVGFCEANGIIIPENAEIHDTMIMSQMLQNLSRSHALDSLAEMIFKYHVPEDGIIEKEAKKLRKKFVAENPDARIGLSQYHMIPEKLMKPYQIADGERCMLLYKCFAPKIFADERVFLDYLNEIDLIRTTCRQEAFGILVDVRQTLRLHDDLVIKVQDAENESLRLVGRKLNLNSSKEVPAYLTETLGLKLEKTTSTGAASAGKDSLMKLRDDHPLIDVILKYRTFSRGITSIDKYTEFMNPSTRRIHANIKTNEAVTGRQSCSEPNLQNVTKEGSERSAFVVPARRCFRADPNTVLFLPDYAGIEFRLIVSESGEEEFIQVMREGRDVHDTAAGVLYGENWDLMDALIVNQTGIKKPQWFLEEENKIMIGNPGKYEDAPLKLAEQIRKNARGGAKNYEFGIAYGGGFGAITASLIGLSPAERRDGDARFKKRWPKVAYFTPNITNQVRTNGFIKTSFGRKLFVRKSEAFAGANYLIQGTAAGILKRAQNRIDLYSRFEHDGKIQMVVPIHDELIISYHRSLLPQKEYILSDIAFLMTDHPEIKVPLEVDFKMTTSNWAASKKFKLHTPNDWEFMPELKVSKCPK